MPFQDLPCRHKRSTPVFDTSVPAKIEHYFSDLEFLFLKNHILADQEKKCTAVRYTSIAVEQLWRTACAFCDTVSSYEDFKAEIITLYPEAIVAYLYTHAKFNNLVSNRAHMLICSETELGEFYHKFLLTLHFLITKGRLGMPEQSHAFLGSLGLCLAIAVHTQLEQTFPDHFPEDLYEAHDIYEAT